MSEMPSERRVNPDYVPTTHKVYVFSEAPATYGVINLHCSNPYLAWAKEIKYPFIIPIFYRKTNDRPT